MHRKDKAPFVASLLRRKRSEDLQRGYVKVIVSTVISSRLAEADKAELPAQAAANRKVVRHEYRIQVEIVVALINDLPRVFTSTV